MSEAKVERRHRLKAADLLNDHWEPGTLFGAWVETGGEGSRFVPEQRVAQALATAEASAQGEAWVLSGKRVPEKGEHVIVCWRDDVPRGCSGIRTATNTTIRFLSDEEGKVFRDTWYAWMPLPQPPKPGGST